MQMMAAALLGALLSVLLSSGFIPVLQRPELLRNNYRKESIPTGGGLLIFSTGLFTAVVTNPPTSWASVIPIMVLLLFAAVAGFVDDLWGSSNRRGFLGHFRSLLVEREVTTGLLKVGIIGVSALLFTFMFSDSPVVQASDAALIALMANTVNLLDLRPGRAGKFFLLAAFPIAAASGAHWLWGLLGSVVGYLKWDLRRQVMMGDTGANMLGAALGAALVLYTAIPIRAGALIGVLAVNILSERIPLGSIIENQPLLLWVDNLGRQ